MLLRIAAGPSNGEIAVELHLGETMVKTYVGRLLAELDARDRVALVITACEEGLVRAQAWRASPRTASRTSRLAAASPSR